MDKLLMHWIELPGGAWEARALNGKLYRVQLVRQYEYRIGNRMAVGTQGPTRRPRPQSERQSFGLTT